MTVCQVAKCKEAARARGYCNKHYMRLLQHGTVEEANDLRKAKLSPSMIDIGWAAGIVEGEGSFSNSQGKTEVLQVTQVNPEPLGKLRLLFGGRVALHPPKGGRGQEYYTWQVSGARARGVMMTMYQLFSEKRREQVRVALGRNPGPIRVYAVQHR